MVSTHGKTSAAAPPKLHEARRRNVGVKIKFGHWFGVQIEVTCKIKKYAFKSASRLEGVAIPGVDSHPLREETSWEERVSGVNGNVKCVE
ncbi:hypothetical protein F2Q70_00021098 [Brassica cretica]|uniref:Uncharacterized protein n=1 Tax=Brassica cretica TaxID=69181 RepID=A0A8S9GXG6_BRACR|nr:hypothetical protein F2Q70_00021098 [Brassica cretica]